MNLENYSNCSVYYFPHGYLTLYDSLTNEDDLVFGKEDYLIQQPILYITNCTNNNYTEVYEYYKNYMTNDVVDLDEFFLNFAVDDYSSSLITVAFAFSAIVISSWMLFIILFVSTHKKPWSLKLANLLSSIAVSVILDQVTKLFIHDSKLDIQDIQRFKLKVMEGTLYLVLMVITMLATWIAWLEIAVYISPVQRQRKIIKAGLLIIVVNMLFTCLNYFHKRDHVDQESSILAVKILAIISQLVLQLCFCCCVLVYTIYEKAKFAFNRRTIPLATISIAIMFCPLIFYLALHYAKHIRIWGQAFYLFAQILSAALIWEWIFDIEAISRNLELKGIVGRQIDESESESKQQKGLKQNQDRTLSAFSSESSSPAGPGAGISSGGKKTKIGFKKFYRKNNRPQQGQRQGQDQRPDQYDIGYEMDMLDGNGSFSYQDQVASISSIHAVNNNVIITEGFESDEDQSYDEQEADQTQAQEHMSGSSSHDVTQPPPPEFEPHRNFEIGDYWLDEKRYS